MMRSRRLIKKAPNEAAVVAAEMFDVQGFYDLV